MDQKGVKVKAEGDFILYSLQDRHMPVFISSWMPEGNYEALPGETIDVYFGTSESPAYVIYELFASNGTRIHRELVSMRNENRAFPVLYQESYGEGMTASFSFVKGGKLYSNSCSIVRKEPERKLTFHTETFRDHLLPGNQENWKFRLVDADSSAVQAEVLASMYDASLDQIRPFRWYLPLNGMYLSGEVISRPDFLSRPRTVRNTQNCLCRMFRLIVTTRCTRPGRKCCNRICCSMRHRRPDP